MASAAIRILVKIIELLGCISCIITKVLTDQEARRVFVLNQKLSREWSLLNNITWSREGNAFANVTYGGFALITTLMLISRCVDSKSKPSLLEKILLTTGMLCFFAMGGLVFASIDQVPSALHDNAIILGCLSFFVAFVILFDLADPMLRQSASMTQTDSVQELSITLPDEDVIDSRKTVVRNNNSSSNDEINVIVSNGNYQRTDDVDIVKTQVFPVAQSPVFEKVLLPERQRPRRDNIPGPNKFFSHVHLNSGYTGEQTGSQGSRAVLKNKSSLHQDGDKTTCCSRDDDNNFLTSSTVSPVTRGFVAHAARMWDSRAKNQNERLNTIV